MVESPLLAQAPAGKEAAAQPSLTDTLTRDAAGISNVPGDIVQLPFLQHLARVLPAADVVFGGGRGRGSQSAARAYAQNAATRSMNQNAASAPMPKVVVG